jgi:hypothetical protein
MSINARRFGRFIRAACPAWLVCLWTICAFIPTPFEIDEALPAVLTLLVLAFQWRRVPRALSAWRGGKSHRAADLAVAR